MTTDLRISKTKDAIRSTFLNILAQKNFEQITVAELSKEANISRKTFYAHYLDKYDLVEKIEAEMSDEFSKRLCKLNPNQMPITISEEEAIKRLLPLLDFIEENLDFFELVAEKKIGFSWYEDVMGTYIDELSNSLYCQNNSWIDYQKDVIKALSASNWNRWVKTGRQESKEDFARWMVNTNRNFFFNYGQ
ncbi:TetR/AcrR family transcriptional regulator [Streptococcus loxodontisalivarius]|uniref:AcrR family transcriptional regulator n=1 Tax=Streptococcus loxodontisalivarius TaxID=1349415 RepID=A0ABS2PT34_9STRE|nr:TetR/AcrR family transcriptional regulator [Streptococcus loxodontisalivarius]MBM7642679.1 AcrR family transcriptional regulator [Streptococcus loxodontisalivarius]